MKKIFIIIVFCLAELMAFSSRAGENDQTTVDKQKLIAKLNQQTIILQKQLDDLRRQLQILKTARQTQKQNLNSEIKQKSTVLVPLASYPGNKPVTINEDIQPTITNLMLLGGVPVVTSAYLGERSAFDGSDLITSFSDINEGLHLL